MTALETRVAAEYGRPLPAPATPERLVAHNQMREMWAAPYRKRTIMMIIFNVFQTVSFYGFANWAPTLLIKQGITITIVCSTLQSSRSPRRWGRCSA